MNDLQLPEPLSFEWDEYNRTKLRLRHNITTEEAEQAFFSERSIMFDERHSIAERRYQLLGKSKIGRILFRTYFKNPSCLQFGNFGHSAKKIFPLNFQLNIKICFARLAQNSRISAKNYF